MECGREDVGGGPELVQGLRYGDGQLERDIRAVYVCKSADIIIDGQGHVRGGRYPRTRLFGRRRRVADASGRRRRTIVKNPDSDGQLHETDIRRNL